MVAAVEARRAYLQPPLPDLPREPDRPVPSPEHLQDDEALDELADAGDGAVQPVGDLTARGDVRAVLERLRRGQSDTSTVTRHKGRSGVSLTPSPWTSARSGSGRW